ncbi:MAG: transposase [Gammaproteobacteria bacterium]|nr:transposase [Gammaproteobacteria bacterium]
MTRPLRLEFHGAVYHLTARGDQREDIFFDDADRLIFLDLLAKEVHQQHWRLYAYCLMSNHYHLLIETPEGNLVNGMRRLNGVYTQAFNRRHGRVGHVLQGRYKSILVDKDAYLLELARYIVLNPVRAGMAQRVEDWPWSSYAITASKRESPGWLDAEWIVKQFGTDPSAARQAYRRFVRDGVDGASPWGALRGQVYLGEDKFLARMERLAVEQDKQGIPASHRQPTRPDAEAVLTAVAKGFGVTPEQAQNRSHQPAFQAWVYFLRRAANLSLREAADKAGISPGRISQIQRTIEAAEPEPVLAGLKRRYKVKTLYFPSLG